EPAKRPASRQTPAAETSGGSPAGRAAGPRSATTAPGTPRADQADHSGEAVRLPEVRPGPARRRPATPQAPGRRDTARPGRGDGVSPAPTHLHGLRHPHLCPVTPRCPHGGVGPPAASLTGRPGRWLPPG